MCTVCFSVYVCAQCHAICANRGYSVTLKPLSQFPVGSSSMVVSKGFPSCRFSRSVGRQPAITHSGDANARHPRPSKQFVSAWEYLVVGRATLTKVTTKSRNESPWNLPSSLVVTEFRIYPLDKRRDGYECSDSSPPCLLFSFLSLMIRFVISWYLCDNCEWNYGKFQWHF